MTRRDFGHAGAMLGRLAAPFTKSVCRWSIAIYSGSSPLALSPVEEIKNPVLTYRDVLDVPAKFVADPFMIRADKTWYLFFEVMNIQKGCGQIALATSNNGVQWAYRQVVLDEHFHLSYPYVFRHMDRFYMIPETHMTNSIRLYEATEFPVKWRHIKNLADGRPFVDSSVIFFNNTWWMFSSTTECNDLYLYYSEYLTGPWIEHPMSPVARKNTHIARPGGRIVVFDGRIFRFGQDNHRTYGNQLRAFEILALTRENFRENMVTPPVLKASGIDSDWNGLAMHHVDPHQISERRWIACVDGKGRYFDHEFMKPLQKIVRGWRVLIHE